MFNYFNQLDNLSEASDYRLWSRRRLEIIISSVCVRERSFFPVEHLKLSRKHILEKHIMGYETGANWC